MQGLRKQPPKGCRCMWERQANGLWKHVYPNEACQVHFKNCSCCGGSGRVPK